MSLGRDWREQEELLAATCQLGVNDIPFLPAAFWLKDTLKLGRKTHVKCTISGAFVHFCAGTTEL